MPLPEAERAALDAQYNLRAAVPEHLTYFARYERDSAALRARWPGRLDLRLRAYVTTGDRPVPATRAPPPRRSWCSSMAATGRAAIARTSRLSRARGWSAASAVALLGYDLAPAVRMDTIVAQVRAGLAWLYRHAPEHGCDPTRLHVAGHSAGGHLAAITLATDWAGFGLPENMIKGVCAISGVFDLEPIRLCYLNEVVGLDADEAHRNSPLHQPLHGRCPVIVAVGELETRAFHEQSRAFAARLEREGWQSQLLVQPGVDHFGIILSMGDAHSPVVQAMARQMGVGSAPT